MSFQLKKEEKDYLLGEAHYVVRRFFNPDLPVRNAPSGENLKELRLGLFASLYTANDLNGCIGRLESQTPILELMPQMLRSAAFSDHRFPPLREEDLPALVIELSLISPLTPVQNPGEIIPGLHGIYLRKDSLSGTYLPQVAEKQKWNALEFLQNCSENKAGLGPDGWKTAELFVYEALIIKG